MAGHTDLSVIYLTLNRLPKRFADFQYRTLQKAVGVYPLLTISREPMPGWNLIDTEEPGYLNIYRQILRGATMCTTPYVAIAEDDCLYPAEHFDFHRPEHFAYNQNRLALFTWGEPMYHWRNRFSNATLIANRRSLIEALAERFDKWGDNWPPQFIGEVGRERVDRGLGVTHIPAETVFSNTSVIQLNHVFANEERQRRKRKAYGHFRSYDIFYCGKASRYQALWSNSTDSTTSSGKK